MKKAVYQYRSCAVNLYGGFYDRHKPIVKLNSPRNCEGFTGF